MLVCWRRTITSLEYAVLRKGAYSVASGVQGCFDRDFLGWALFGSRFLFQRSTARRLMGLLLDAIDQG